MGKNRQGYAAFKKSGWHDDILVHAIEEYGNTYRYRPPVGTKIRLQVRPSEKVTWVVWAFVTHSKAVIGTDDSFQIEALYVSFYDQVKELEAIAMLKSIPVKARRQTLKIYLYGERANIPNEVNSNPRIRNNRVFYDVVEG